MPPELNGMFFDPESGRYFAVPRAGTQIQQSSMTTRRLQKKIDTKLRNKSNIRRNTVVKDQFSYDQATSWKYSTDILELYSNSLHTLPRYMKLSTLVSPKYRGFTQFSETAYQLHQLDNLMGINSLDFVRGNSFQLPSLIHGILTIPCNRGLGLLCQLHLEREPHYNQFTFAQEDAPFNLVGDSQGPLMFEPNFIMHYGFNTSNKLVTREILKRWTDMNNMNRERSGFKSMGHIITSDITFIYQCTFLCTGFRNGTLLIKDSRVPNHQSILNIGSSVCCVRFLRSNGYTICIASGVENVLKSYKLNDISLEWEPFQSYNGYTNSAKLCENLKVASSINDDINSPHDRIFAVESYDSLLERNTILFYDFTSSKPLKTNEIPVDFNSNSYCQWSIINSTLLLYNSRQHLLESYQINIL